MEYSCGNLLRENDNSISDDILSVFSSDRINNKSVLYHMYCKEIREIHGKSSQTLKIT